MLVTVNGQQLSVPDGATVDIVLQRLLAQADVEGSRGVAIAVHGEVVPRSRWGATKLSPGAVVEVLTAVQGG
jgi:sulfur carrier protein